MKIQESAQDYLEAILVLSKDNAHVRAIDICNYFGYARATVSVYLKQLKENGYITIDSSNHIFLTEEGTSIAEETLRRHHFLTELFVKIGVPEEIAAEDACRVEHYVSAETFEALRNYFSK